ncbi:tetratricopeptide repeat protein [Psychrobacter sp. AOP22-C1-C5]|uniref:tetratricopeptide repeat protein n=1 Tax=Psychrobacter sp. AOP22-C1-C5 TaxID=3457716 RepID=UPI0040353F87
MSASLLTPLDYIAAGYWQDFLAERPIAGGIAYEAELRSCVLDESLASLQRIDTLLSQIRRDMIKVGQWHEETILVDERYRNFMVFLAFYAGRVLARQWQKSPHWYGQFELRKRYPHLSLITDDFYQHMAVVYRDDVESNADTSVFFALEPIGLRLFGHIDRPFEAVQGGQVASGLYQAVNTRLPNANDVSAIETVAHNTIQNIDISKNTDIHLKTEASINTGPLSEKSLKKLTDDIVVNEVLENTDVAKQDSHTTPQLAHAETLLANTSSDADNLILTKPAPSLKISPTPEMFTQLLTELDEIIVVQTAHNTEYQQACDVLDQFERHIAKQDKPRMQIVFSESHLAAKKQALLKLQRAANAGNTAAMLRLAMYQLLGEGLTVDDIAEKESGAEWVKQAASKDDSRAQRLLSKMYYQGVGVAQDIENGQYWLTQAAKNGHVEAADLVVHWQQAQELISTQKQEQHSIKRYQILLGAVTVIAILILFLV